MSMIGHCRSTRSVVNATSAPSDIAPCATAMPPIRSTSAIAMLGMSSSSAQNRPRNETISSDELLVQVRPATEGLGDADAACRLLRRGGEVPLLVLHAT